MNNTMKITLEKVAIPLIQTYQADLAIPMISILIHMIYINNNI